MSFSETTIKVPAKSFLVELLSLHGELDQETLDVQIHNLSSKIELIKSDMVNELERRFMQFIPSYNKAFVLNKKLDNLLEEIGELHHKVPLEIKTSIETSSIEILELQTKFFELSKNMKLVTVLRDIPENLQRVSTLIAKDDISGAALFLKRIEDNFEELEDVAETEMNIISALMISVDTEKCVIEKQLRNIWDTHVKFYFDDKISMMVNGDRLLKDSVLAMISLNCQSQYLCTLSKDFAVILDKILSSKSVLIDSEKEGPINSLDIVLDYAGENTTDTFEVSDKKIEVLLTVNNFLITNIIVHFQEDSNVENRDSFQKLFGNPLTSKLKDYLVKHVPSEVKDMDQYRLVVSHALEIESHLLKNGLLTEPGLISLYHDDIDRVFSQQQCIRILTRAREILCLDLLKGQEVVGSTSGWSVIQRTMSPECEDLLRKSILDDNAFLFPTCQISLTTKKLFDLVIETMETAVTSPAPFAHELYLTARNCIALFREITPEFHKNKLNDIPFAAALFQNDCYYLAHSCLTIGEKFWCKTSPKKQIQTFIDQVPSLRALGDTIFLKQLSKQKSILLKLMKDGGLHHLGNDLMIATKYEKTAQGCLVQLNHLRKIWLGVLPVNVFQRSLGTLVNTVVDELINQLVRVEDIPADEAVKLTTVLEMMIKDTPSVIKVDSDQNIDMMKFVPKWGKLKEMVIILGASMKQISERWCTGTLSSNFTVDEVKHLIRALFQNTDRRAMTLSSIK